MLISGSPPIDIELHDSGYFAWYDDRHGTELWRTVGTSSGTDLLKDINPSGASDPADFTALGNVVFFSADDGEHGRELWRSDGTEDGTRLVLDINPGSASSNPAHSIQPSESRMIAFNGHIYFSADDGVHGYELWRSDGTVEGTKLVKDINTANASSTAHRSSMPYDFAILDDELFFGAFDGEPSLWKTDGTESGTTLLHAPGLWPGQLTSAGQAVYYTPNTFPGVLWKSDGTPHATQMVFDSNSSAPHFAHGDIEQLTPHRDGVAFVVSDSFVLKLNKQGGVLEVLPQPSEARSFYDVRDLVEYRADLFFIANLWAGNVLLRGIWKNSSQSDQATLYHAGEVTSLVKTEHALFFLVNAESSQQLWVSYGAEGTPSLLGEFPNPSIRTPFVSNLRARGNVATFHVKDLQASETLWQSDGTPAGTRPLLELGKLVDIAPGAIAQADGTDVFLAVGVGPSFDLFDLVFRSDGTRAGTEFVTYGDISGSVPRDTAVIQNVLFRNDSGYSIWRSDGTPAGTYEITIPNNRIGRFVQVDNKLVFLSDEFDQLHLGASDGTPEGTSLLRSLGSGHYYAQIRVNERGEVFVTTFGSATGNSFQFWRTDGTVEGTTLIDERPHWAALNGLFGMTPDGSALVLVQAESGWILLRGEATAAGATVVATGPEMDEHPVIYAQPNGKYLIKFFSPAGYTLWTTDGTSGGTHPIPGLFGINDFSLVGHSSTKSFFDRLSQSGKDVTREVWATDGTNQGTVRVLSFPTDRFRYSPVIPAGAIGDQFYFIVEQLTDTIELWVTDGTEVGTRKIEDRLDHLYSNTVVGDHVYYHKWNSLWTLDEQGIPTELTNLPVHALTPDGSNLLFLATVGVGKVQLWESDGTLAGTRMVTDLPFDGHVRILRVMEGTILLAQGNRIWAVPRVHADVQLKPNGGEVLIRREEADLIVSQQGDVLFQQSTSTIGSLTIHGTAGPELYILDFERGAPSLPGGIRIVDSAGHNEVHLRNGGGEITEYALGDQTAIAIDRDRFEFTGISLFHDSLQSAKRTFEFGPGDDDVAFHSEPETLAFTRLSSANQSVVFAHPSEFLAIHMGDGDDHLQIKPANESFTGRIEVNGVVATGDRDTVELVGDWRITRRESSFSTAGFVAEFAHIDIRLMAGPFSWHNPLFPTDVNGDGLTSPSDALMQINASQISPFGMLSESTATAGLFFPDVSGDGNFTAMDILIVINALNRRQTGRSTVEHNGLIAISAQMTSQSGEGELLSIDAFHSRPVPGHDERTKDVATALPSIIKTKSAHWSTRRNSTTAVMEELLTTLAEDYRLQASFG